MPNMTKFEVDKVLESGDIEVLRSASFALKEEIVGIQGQITSVILQDSAKEDSDWFVKANHALKIKKIQLSKINNAINAIQHKAREAKRLQNKEKVQLQNRYFYAKLKELLSPADLETFMADTDKCIEEELAI